MAIIKMQMNVPVQVQQAKYLDVMPPGKFGSQFRLKGTIDGDTDAVLYIPGKVWVARRVFITTGIIDETAFDEEPKEAVNIPLLKTAFVLTNKQVQGKNYGNIEVVVPSNGSAPVQHTATGKTSGPLLPNESGEEEYLKALTGYTLGKVAMAAPVAVVVDPKMADIDMLKECVGYALGIAQDAQKLVDGKLDVVFTGDNVCSLASTLFIRWTRK